jgi:hypothetical protein
MRDQDASEPDPDAATGADRDYVVGARKGASSGADNERKDEANATERNGHFPDWSAMNSEGFTNS